MQLVMLSIRRGLHYCWYNGLYNFLYSFLDSKLYNRSWRRAGAKLAMVPDKSDNEQFGTWLKARRKALGLSRRELAVRANCSEVTIVKIEGGERRPSVQVAEQLALALDLPAGERDRFVAFARSTHIVGAVRASAAGAAGTVRSARPAADQLQEAGKGSKTNLPSPATRFVGREGAVAKACGLIRSPFVRSLTLTGPPGIGKTRLGLRIAGEVYEDFPDGVFFVDLSSIRRPDLLAGALAGVLGVRESRSAHLLQDLKARISGRQMLLVLDNFEQILVAAPLLGELLYSSGGLKMLVTSREALRIYGEHHFPVYPLSLPQLGERPKVKELGRYSAIQLFVDRASAIEPTFALSEENGPLVLEICRELEGVPLAIELAAARMWDFTPAEIRLGLSSKLQLLKEGPGDLPARQRTLRGAIDWSYELLSSAERTLLNRMSVFSGGCSLEAAVWVCASGNTSQIVRQAQQDGAERGERGDRGPNLRSVLASLLAKSLLHYDHTGTRAQAQRDGPAGVGEGEGASTKPRDERRVSMLETIREYAWERLLESGEADDLQGRHARYYLVMVEEAEPYLEARQDPTWLGRLEPEHGNLRTALDWCKGLGVGAGSAAGGRPSGIEMGLRIAGALCRFWELRGYVSEGRWYLEQLLDLERLLTHEQTRDQAEDNHTGAAVLQKALRAAGLLALYQGDFRSARALYEERLTLVRELGEPASIASALNDLGVAARAAADYDYARVLYEESLTIRRTLDDRQGTASSLNSLATLALIQGNLSLAHSLAQESLQIRRELGIRFGIALSLQNLGDIERSLGNFAGAELLYTEYFRLNEEMEDKPGSANALHNLAHVAYHGGDWGRAAHLFGQALSMYQEWGDRPGLAECLAGLAELAVSRGHAEEGALLFGAVEALLETTNFRLSPPDKEEYERGTALARSLLGEARFVGAISRGLTMGLGRAIDYALKETGR